MKIKIKNINNAIQRTGVINNMKISKQRLARMIKEAIEDAAESLGEPVPPEELRDALWSHISDMFKAINGFRPRGMYDWQNMPIEELENLHHKLSAELEEQAQDDEYDDEWYEQRHMDDQDAWLKSQEEQEAIQATKDEEERMLTPEEGEEFPRRMGMRKKMRRVKRMEEAKAKQKQKIFKLVEEVLEDMLREEEGQADIQQQGQVKSSVAAADKAEDKNKVAAKKTEKVDDKVEIQQMIINYIQKLASNPNVDAKELKQAVYKVNTQVQKA